VNVEPFRRYEYGMLGWLTSLFKDRSPVPPVMVRVRARAAEGMKAAPPSEVRVEAVFYPSGKRLASRAKDAQGLCMVHWIPDSDRAELVVRACGSEGKIAIRATEAREGRAFDLSLG
jgi:hypothetical protein